MKVKLKNWKIVYGREWPVDPQPLMISSLNILSHASHSIPDETNFNEKLFVRKFIFV